MSKEEQGAEDHTVHQPDYVILDAEEEAPRTDDSGEMFDTLKKISAKHFPWPMRIACVILCLFFLGVAVLLFIHVLFHIILATVTLYQNPALNTNVKKAWNLLVSDIVIALGLAIAFFSPAFGFSVMMLYFMLHRENRSGAFVQGFFTKNI